MEGIYFMIELDFKEPETFKTPDGEEWIINPLDTVDMKLIVKLTSLDSKQRKLQSEGKIEELNEVVYGESVDFSNEIIDKSIVNKKTGELLPGQYRKPYTRLVELVKLVVNETVGIGNINDEDGDNPLENQAKSSEPSEDKSISSKKKGGRRKN